MPFQTCQELGCKKICYVLPGIQIALGHGLCDEHLRVCLNKEDPGGVIAATGLIVLKCPECGSSNMMVEFNTNGPEVWDQVTCHGCGKLWERAEFVEKYPDSALAKAADKDAQEERDKNKPIYSDVPRMPRDMTVTRKPDEKPVDEMNEAELREHIALREEYHENDKQYKDLDIERFHGMADIGMVALLKIHSDPDNETTELDNDEWMVWIEKTAKEAIDTIRKLRDA